MCDFNIFELHQNEDLLKKLEDYPQKRGQDSQKTRFQGVVPPDLSPFRGSDPMCGLNIFKLHQNEDLFKN